MNTEQSKINHSGLVNREYYAFRLLAEVEGIGAVKIKSLYTAFSSLEPIFSASIQELSNIDGITHELAFRVKRKFTEETDLLAKLEKEFIKLSSLGGRCITLWDDEYPPMLKKIYDPPLALYILGEIIPQDEKGIGIVGTRLPTSYGRQAAEKFSKELSEAGWTIISGMARGIDTAAHEAALRARGRTIAVLGSGLDKIYPAENKGLSDAIVRNGAVITEYPIGTGPDGVNFPKRNRIISGLSKGVLIVEAKNTGGALITAKYAADQNREVFAVPGSIFSPNSDGTNLIIKRCEAKPVSRTSDIQEEFGEEQKSIAQKKQKEAVAQNLNLFEQKIVSCLSEHPVAIDKLAHLTLFSISDCLVYLLMLEFKGVVRQLPGKMFILE